MTENNEEYGYEDLIFSDLEQSITLDGSTVEIDIYRLPDTDWTAEVVDEFGNSTVFVGTFASDQEALDTVMHAIKEEGIQAFVGSESD